MNGIDPEQAMSVLRGLDDEQVNAAVARVVDEFIVPRAAEIRQEAQNHPPAEEVRQSLKELPKEKQEELFHETVADLVMLAAEVRDRPTEAAPRLRDVVRDPHTMETLLLVFDEEPEVDPEYADELKDFVTTEIRWMAAHLAPELYTKEELMEVTGDLYPEYTDGQKRQLLQDRGIEIE